MNTHIRIGVVSEKRLFNRISGLVADEARGSLLTIYNTVKDLLSAADLPDLAIIRFRTVNISREILSETSSGRKAIPVVFIYPEASLSVPDFKDLVINGAFGMVPDTNLKSLIQHIHRLTRGNETVVKQGGISDYFETFFNNSDSLVSIINSDLKYESANDLFMEYHNLERCKLKGACPSHLWGEEVFREKIEQNLKKCLNGEVIRYKAFFDRQSDGGRCYEVVYRPVKPAGDRSTYSLVETRDVTGTEDAIRRGEEAVSKNYYYEKYLPFGLFESTSSGEITDANETFYNILEVPAGERRGLNLTAFTGSDRRLTGYLESVREGESTTFSQLQMTTARGNEIYARLSTHTRRERDGSLRINATLEDNTREVLLENKLSKTHRMETLGTLAGGIAHDFNTILTTITGYAEMTMDEVDRESEAFDYQTRLLNSVRRAEDIVKQMLTFSKQIDVELVPVVIEKVLDEACDFVESAMRPGLVLTRSIEPLAGMAKADPTQLFRVFLNIMTNALQAMESGPGKLKVTCRSYSRSERRFAEIEISDTGKGIEKAIIDRIYEPFFSTRKPGEGTGMGLAVVHGIVTGMGGEIEVESSPGAGTCFRIRVPVHNREDIDDSSRMVEEGTILYADSNIYFSRTVAHALEKYGYRVTIASSSADLERMLSNRSELGDIIFLRCNFESDIKERLVERIVGENSDIRLVLISDPGSSAFRKYLRSELANVTIINEPVTLKDIVNTIRNR